MRAVRWIVVIAIIAGVCWLFPLFHVVPLQAAKAEKAAAAFNAEQFADTFWTNQLLPSVSQAIKADTLLAAIQSDPESAKKKYSRSLGFSGSYFYYLSGTGRVVSVSDEEISLAITPGTTNSEVTLLGGLIFGDAVRDGTGLLNASAYSNSQDFNDISAALDHLVETRVLPGLHEQAKIGAEISFAGCAEVDDEGNDLKPLKVIPIQTKTP
jgi:predicted lipoprotein